MGTQVACELQEAKAQADACVALRIKECDKLEHAAACADAKASALIETLRTELAQSVAESNKLQRENDKLRQVSAEALPSTLDHQRGLFNVEHDQESNERVQDTQSAEVGMHVSSISLVAPQTEQIDADCSREPAKASLAASSYSDSPHLNPDGSCVQSSQTSYTPECFDSKAPESPQRKDRVFHAFDILESGGQEEDNECESLPDATEDAGQEEDAGSGLSPHATEGAGREEDNECESLPDATDGAGREEDAGSGLSPRASEGAGREEDNESGMLPRAIEAPDDNAV